MIDWPLVLKITLGGYGTNILVLVILAIAIWIIGLILQKAQGQNKVQSEKKE